MSLNIASARSNNYASLPDFVAKASKTNNLGPNSHLVIGNEAGDADSIVSALALAYVDSSFGIISNNDDSNGNASSSSTCNAAIRKKIPVVSIPRADLCLRRETVLLLEMANINVDELLFIDDDDDINDNNKDLYNSKKFVTLVDHNRLTLEKANSSWEVVEIIDHHLDEKAHPTVQGERARNIAFETSNNGGGGGKALVASTCTLVAERLFETFATTTTTTSSSSLYYPTELSLALLGVILLDTVNMDHKAGKVTQRDRVAVETLLKRTNWSTLLNDDDDDSKLKHNFNYSNLLIEDSTDDGSVQKVLLPSTDKLFRLLSESKFDSNFWKELSVRDALRLDYKRFQSSQTMTTTTTLGCFGASSILLDMSTFLQKPNLETEILSFLTEFNIPLLVVLSMTFSSEDGTPQRELLLCGKKKSSNSSSSSNDDGDGDDNDITNDMAQHLLTNPTCQELLQLEERTTTTTTTTLTMRHFVQGNAKASRKQVVPVMLNFYQQD